MLTCSAILVWAYRAPSARVRRLIRKLILWREGGELRSESLRQIFAAYHGVEVGLYSYGCFTPRDIPPGTRIGRYCSIAPGVVIFNANHPLEHRSLHPFFYNPELGVVPEETITRGKIVIGHDVWIGRNALITPRVRSIGNGAVVGAGCVVTRDVPAYAVVAGNPGRVIRYRFPHVIQEQIEASRWWERSIEELRGCVDAFVSPVQAAVDQRWLALGRGEADISTIAG